MIYYSLSILLLAGIREILLISSSQALPQFKGFFGDGSNLGIKIDYVEQNALNGIAEALILAEPYVDGHETALILGTIFFTETESPRSFPLLRTAQMAQPYSVIGLATQARTGL